MTTRLEPTADEALYDADFYAWTQRTAALLRARQFGEADIDHAAEEIEDMGKREANELNSRMRVLLFHLLQWQFQPERRSRSWKLTITTQRQEISINLLQSPSLRPRLTAELAANYRRSVDRAAVQTGLPPTRFPRECPYSVEQILDVDFLPD